MVDNIFLLTVDALGAKHVGFLGYDRNTTPYLDEFSERGIQCQAAIAQSSHTRESMPSLFYSAYPFQLGEVGPVPDSRPTITTELADAGFTTAGFHSNPYLSRAYGFDRGFDTFDDGLPLAKNRILTFLHRAINHFQLQPYTRAEDLNAKGLNWIDTTTADRRFLWLHYMDPHGPYQPPDNAQRLFRDETLGRREAKKLWRRTVDEPETISEEERKALIDLYDAEIRYTDKAIGSFIDELEARGLLDSSVVIVTADHGDTFGEHGIYGHPRQLYEELIHVPLLILTPEGSSTHLTQPVENIDIGPTILQIIDRDIPGEFEGSPLIDKSESSADSTRSTAKSSDAEQASNEPAAFAETHGESDDVGVGRFAIRTKRYKYHVETTPDSTVKTRRLFDLFDDPEERTHVQKELPDVRERLNERLHQHISRTQAVDRTADDQSEVDAVVEDRLENLGYQ
ncbi:sulfatase-like hydrolase/transferase [Halorubrum tropicale]|uniref:sulfatase-like hydrolase/transferase n=1 Tax=Halorubrum tropicale TaxID=1765655 RepID=UPI00097F7B8B|nr:sulfatase-like hydrolase/transferase [Halorubrum tropicale]